MILLIFCPSFLGLFSAKANSWVSSIPLMLLLKLLKREALAIRIRFLVEKNEHRWKKSCFSQKKTAVQKGESLFSVSHICAAAVYFGFRKMKTTFLKAISRFSFHQSAI